MLDPILDPRPGLVARATVHRTPCGTGDLVWHRWTMPGAIGRPIVLVHGGAGSWTHWISTIPALLAADHEVWAVDLPGLGDSAMPPAPPTPGTCAAIVATGIGTLFGDRRQPHLVGFSWGAHVSTIAAVELGDRLASLTIVGSSAIGLGDAGLAPFPKPRSTMTAAELTAVHHQTLAMLMIRQPSRIDELALAIQADNVGRSRFRSRDFSRSSDIAEALAGVDVPVTGIWGACDVLAVPSIAAVHPALTAHRRPGQAAIGWRQIEDAGHWVMYEQPDAFNRTLQEVIAAVEAAAPD